MKPKIAQQKISAALLVTLLAIGSASAIADFQGIDDALKPYHSHLLIGTANVNIEVDTSTEQARNIADAPTATANSRLLESSYSGDALLYTLGLDFLANNYLAVRSKFERWLSLDNAVVTTPLQNRGSELSTVNSGLRFVF